MGKMNLKVIFFSSMHKFEDSRWCPVPLVGPDLLEIVNDVQVIFETSHVQLFLYSDHHLTMSLMLPRLNHILDNFLRCSRILHDEFMAIFQTWYNYVMKCRNICLPPDIAEDPSEHGQCVECSQHIRNTANDVRNRQWCSGVWPVLWGCHCWYPSSDDSFPVVKTTCR